MPLHGSFENIHGQPRKIPEALLFNERCSLVTFSSACFLDSPSAKTPDFMEIRTLNLSCLIVHSDNSQYWTTLFFLYREGRFFMSSISPKLPASVLSKCTQQVYTAVRVSLDWSGPTRTHPKHVSLAFSGYVPRGLHRWF